MDIVRFKGGLGNQMFQYALVEALRSRGREVRISLGFYRNHPSLRPFILDKVFEEIKVLEIEDEVFNEIDKRWKAIKEDAELMKDFIKKTEDRFFYVEKEDGVYDSNIFLTNNCTFVGYFQSDKYFSDIEATIVNDFKFSYGEDKLEYLKEEFLRDGKYVAVHVRRGDYLENIDFWGKLWESSYYEKAIKYIKDRVLGVKPVFFSDDIEWVKSNYKEKEAVYIERSMFEHYQPWYDMCLMSCCSHNIIANSSFSWWGAWLNQNSRKIVIAPETWLFDGKSHGDIYPDGWIRLQI